MTDHDLNALRDELAAVRERPAHDDEDSIAVHDELIDLPRPGEVVEHYKGGLYTVITVGRMSEARDALHVVYKSHSRKTVWIRPLGMFVEIVEWPDGSYRPRFCSSTVVRDYERLPCGVRADCGGP